MKNRSIAVVASVLLLVGRAPLAAQCWPASLCQDSCDSCQSCELSDAAPVSCGSATCVEVVACPEACDEVSPPTTPAVEDVVPSASTTEVAPPEEDVASEEPPAAPPGDTTLSDEPAAPPAAAKIDAERAADLN